MLEYKCNLSCKLQSRDNFYSTNMTPRLSFSSFSSFHLCLLVVLALFRSCSSKQNSEHVLCIDAERQALLRFKHGLTDETHRLASWVAENKDCCNWYGITCDNSTGHVHRVHLPGHGGHCPAYSASYFTEKEYTDASKQRLKGDISRSLLDLKQLKHLDLSCNDFRGIQVPKFIGSLQNLKYLNLSNSKFGGTIPPQLGNLSNLNVLCLGSFHEFNEESTSMMNMQWLSGLGMLHHLDMSGVDLSEAVDWLQVINTLPSLVELHLSSCALSDIHPYVHRLNLTSLSLLDLSGNYFYISAPPQWISSMTSLVSLDLSMGFLGPLPSFRNLTSLEFLYLNGNNLMNSSLVLEELSNSNLISLGISSCGISSTLIDSLHNLTSLLSLDLSYNQLTRIIPKSLGNLCNVREIDLSWNSFGNITLTYLLKSFLECKSPALESLSLRGNYIDSIIPLTIGQLSLLRRLDISLNQVSGPIPYSMGRLSSLEVLDLSDNRINGSLPNWIGRLSSLKELILSNNQLDGNLPDSLGQISKLNSLGFSNNSLTGVVTESHFAKLVSLNYLDGAGNNLTFRPQVESWIPAFQLRELYLNSWVLGPDFPLWLQSQKKLTELDISNTHISSPMPESFFDSFPNLAYLDMSENRIQGNITLLVIPATLEEVNLSFNELLGSLQHLLCSNGVTKIKFLNLGNNNLSGVIRDCWEKWPSLGVLNLENNNLSGEIPRTLGSIDSLEFLSMRGNKISGRLPSSLMKLMKLKVLQLGRNELTGRIPTWIGTKLTLLRLLNLRANNLDGSISHEICYLNDVQILDLAHNNLDGNIPSCFNNFSILSGIEATPSDLFAFNFGRGPAYTIIGDSLVIKGREDTYNTILGLVMLLDLSSNNLVGHIPSELTSLTELRSLNLSRNHLTGRIPEKIGGMKSLESFDLSLNNLYGELPISLSMLNFLSSFNVSNNNFSGRIPTSTQLQSMKESSFLGNKLCGAPLTQNKGCVPRTSTTNTSQEEKEDGGGDWGLIISIVVGFVTGFWIILGPLIVKRSWRIAYFNFLSRLSYMVYNVTRKYCCHMFSKL
ncbi:putative leucine-rich repeat-containing, plant-type, leucine-rich repeat domain superfamily [Helianthus annuus]|uniref:Leucine-rich repeat-containing, plant-type, leucine-rich repeat domain superfamily n=2 Tax=Helianthus annuus TaxID=4232 RepID=A0A9K3J4L7_HELAN|nr:putative leucine-rich repeat-containing, plant-type, leucine-rich repeat domain superfamily [Helianthus annuus]KAJ0586815.1 putative leucine-rich repeat-containing, plant-type, leucine-rich repeat domain superfamily [Helianthus annuus]